MCLPGTVRGQAFLVRWAKSVAANTLGGVDGDLDAGGREFPEEDLVEQSGPGLFDDAGEAAPQAGSVSTSAGQFKPDSDGMTKGTMATSGDDKGVREPTGRPLASGEIPTPDAPVAATPDAPAPDNDPGAPLALYRRYRPDTFEQVIGQEHVTVPLQRAIANNRVSHAYLFSGPRGCGKTTCARILARCLNCENGPTPTPCGHCTSCRELATGGPGSIDVIEIDAASHGRVDDARELREGIFFAPVQSRYKIYIIDEAHMVTKEGFNALLKVVEEPPAHVKFIFATTEPEKVIGTIRSRTHHYPFRLVPPKILTGYLEQICAEEHVQVEPGVLPLVVRAGAGSVRDSLSVLDQLLGSAGPDGVSYQQATSLLGYTPDALLDEMVDALAAHDGKGVFSTIDKVIEIGQDPRRFAEDLLQRLRDLVIVADVPDALSSGLIDVAADQAQRFEHQAALIGPGELTRAGEVIADGLTHMRGTTAPRLHLELMCARMLLPGADVDDRGTHARLDRLERRVGMPGVSDESAPEQPASPQWDDQADVSGGHRPAAGNAPTQQRPPRQRHPIAPAQTPSRSGQPAATPAAHEPAAPATSRGPEMSATSQELGPAANPRGTSRMPETPAASPTSGAPTAPRPPEPSASVRPSRGEAAPEPGTAFGPAVTADSATSGPSAVQGQGPSASNAPTPSSEQAPESAPGRLNTAELRRLWPDVLTAVKGRRRFTWILLSQNAQVLQAEADGITLVFNSAGARDSFQQRGSEDVLRDALIDVVGADLPIRCVVEGTAAMNEARSGEPAAQRPAPGQRPAANANPTASSGSAANYSPDPGDSPAPSDRSIPGNGTVSDNRPDHRPPGPAQRDQRQRDQQGPPAEGGERADGPSPDVSTEENPAVAGGAGAVGASGSGQRPAAAAAQAEPQATRTPQGPSDQVTEVAQGLDSQTVAGSQSGGAPQGFAPPQNGAAPRVAAAPQNVAEPQNTAAPYGGRAPQEEAVAPQSATLPQEAGAPQHEPGPHAAAPDNAPSTHRRGHRRHRIPDLAHEASPMPTGQRDPGADPWSEPPAEVSDRATSPQAANSFSAQARHEIVRDEPMAGEEPPYDPDADVSMNDPDVDESGKSATELLISELGAEVIEEIEHG